MAALAASDETLGGSFSATGIHALDDSAHHRSKIPLATMVSLASYCELSQAHGLAPLPPFSLPNSTWSVGQDAETSDHIEASPKS